jgi:hypothetical protein
MVARVLAVWLVIAAVETLHGILRVRLLNRRLGDRRARQVGVVTGSLLILAVAVLSAPWLALPDASSALAVGAVWAALMLAYEVGLGRFVFRMPWARIGADFDPRRGGFLALGFVVLVAAPWLAGRWHGWW